MDRKPNPITKEGKSPPLLTITGKTMQIPILCEDKSKKRLTSPQFYRRISTACKPNRLESSMATYLASGISFISQKRNSAAMVGEFSKTMMKSSMKSVLTESIDFENNSKIYKCMSNPNVNGNSNLYGNPIKSIGISNDNSVIYKPSTGYKRNSNTPKMPRVKIVLKKPSLGTNLLKTNGLQCKEEEEPNFKYFVGLGNNSQLISKIMKNRSRWKRVHSYNSANFIWTAVKKCAIIDFLSSQSDDLEKIVSTKPTSEFPSVLTQDHFCTILPLTPFKPSKTRLYNRLCENRELTSKKRLFYNMHKYYTSKNIDPFSKIPLTYHVLYGSYDATFKNFVSKFYEIQKTGATNVWIIKPGEGTNRGIGINVCKTIESITNFINSYDNEDDRTYIIQKYIENPLLYKSRKFDIRCYALITSIQGNIQCYFYKEGYLRTSSAEYSVKNVENKFIHLTNDAVQKYCTSYGKHEAGNKLSYAEFQEYLSKTFEGSKDFYSDILPQIKAMVTDTVLATYEKLDPEKKLHCFEILGYDFMIDSNFQVWLIEVNTNPCLELSSPYLEILIPKMVENAFALTVDQLFPNDSGGSNDFELVFNQAMFELKNKKETGSP